MDIGLMSGVLGAAAAVVAVPIAWYYGHRSTKPAAAISDLRRAVGPWRAHRAERLARRVTAADGYPGLLELLDEVRTIAGRRRKRAFELIRALAGLARATGRLDLAADHESQMAIYDIVRSEAPFAQSLVQDAYLQTVKQHPADMLLATHPVGLKNLLKAITFGLIKAQITSRNAATQQARDEAQEEAGRLTGIIELLAQAARRGSPAVARLVAEELLAPTAPYRDEVKAMAFESLPGDPPQPNLNYCEFVARGYTEQIEQPDNRA